MRTADSGRLLREVVRLFTQAQSVVIQCNTTTNSQCNLLAELARSGPLALSELGVRFRREKSWVSRSVEALAGHGLVVKVNNAADSRKWLVTLTDEGLQSVNAWNAALDNHAEHSLAHLSDGDRVAVEKSLFVLLKAMKQD